MARRLFPWIVIMALSSCERAPFPGAGGPPQEKHSRGGTLWEGSIPGDWARHQWVWSFHRDGKDQSYRGVASYVLQPGGTLLAASSDRHRKWTYLYEGLESSTYWREYEWSPTEGEETLTLGGKSYRCRVRSGQFRPET